MHTPDVVSRTSQTFIIHTKGYGKEEVIIDS